MSIWKTTLPWENYLSNGENDEDISKDDDNAEEKEQKRGIVFANKERPEGRDVESWGEVVIILEQPKTNVVLDIQVKTIVLLT